MQGRERVEATDAAVARSVRASARRPSRPERIFAIAPAGTAARPPAARSWYRITNLSSEPVAEIYVYDEVGMWGVSAGDFINELAAISADRIDVHLNTPGGEVYDGIAIRNALETHPAAVHVYVDALAASIGSVIAQAGDRRVMGRNSQMMIHNAFALTVGDSDDHRATADLLDKHNDNIADIYTRRSGTQTKAQWLKAMKAETWYSAEEAVAAGLADEVMEPPKRHDDDMPENHWDLSIFRYAGRAAAPAPVAVAGVGEPGARSDVTPAGASDRIPDTAAPVAADDAGFTVPDGFDLGAAIRAGHETAIDDTVPWAEGLGDLIVASVDHELSHRPAPPDNPAAPVTEPPPFDSIEFATSLKEAIR